MWDWCVWMIRSMEKISVIDIGFFYCILSFPILSHISIRFCFFSLFCWSTLLCYVLSCSAMPCPVLLYLISFNSVNQFTARWDIIYVYKNNYPHIHSRFCCYGDSSVRFELPSCGGAAGHCLSNRILPGLGLVDGMLWWPGMGGAPTCQGPPQQKLEVAEMVRNVFVS